MTTLIPKYSQVTTSNRTIAEKFAEVLSVKDFGAVGDGVTDDTTAIKAAINAAQGGEVYFPLGNYVISSPLDVGTNGYELRLIGASSAYCPSTFVDLTTYTNTNTFTTACIQNYSTLGKRYSAIQCNGCSLVGQADTGVVNGCTTAKQISNLCIYGTNNALVGIYLTSANDCLISNCNIGLFKNFGLLIRGGTTTTYQKVGFSDNGWGLAASGTLAYTNTYYSGCQIMVVSNQTPNDYTTVGSVTRATTQQFRDIYMNVRGWMVQNLSGYLGMQCSGALGFSMDGLGSYSGCIFYLSSANINGLYIENYSYNGLTTSVQDPHGLYSLASTLQIGTNYVANLTRTAIVPYLYDSADYLLYGAAVSNMNQGYVIQNGFVGSQYNTNITVGISGGGSATYTVFQNAIPNNVGFHGLITLSLQKVSDIATYATAVYVASKHTDSVPTQKIPTSTQLQAFSSGSGIYIITITNVNFASNGGITFTVTWGSGYGTSESFLIDIGLIGGQTNSFGSIQP